VQRKATGKRSRSSCRCIARSPYMPVSISRCRKPARETAALRSIKNDAEVVRDGHTPVGDCVTQGGANFGDLMSCGSILNRALGEFGCAAATMQ
jgi:hypothetical protein